MLLIGYYEKSVLKIYITLQILRTFSYFGVKLVTFVPLEQMYLEDKVKEADSLTFKIDELEVLLSKEKEEGKRYHC